MDNFPKKNTKNGVFGPKMVKKGSIRLKMDQKGLKMYEKKQKMEFSDLKYLLFSKILLSGIGGYPAPPLNGKSSAQKPLATQR